MRGLPKAVGQKQGAVYLTYPAPVNRSSELTVWFSDDRLVYCTGYDLEKDGEPFFLYGMEGLLLEQELGALEPLNALARWWPEHGVVLFGNNNIWPHEALGSPLGLRDPSFPIESLEPEKGQRWSSYEPWLDDERVSWLAEDIELGMPQERARKLAGALEVVYEAGFVRAVRGATDVLLIHQVGTHDHSLQFLVGEEPTGMGPTPVSFPENGWYSPAPGGRVRLENRKVAEVELALTCDNLFQALRETLSGGDSPGRVRDRERSRQLQPRELRK